MSVSFWVHCRMGVVGWAIIRIKVNQVSLGLHINVGNILVQHHPTFFRMCGWLVYRSCIGCDELLFFSSCLYLVHKVERSRCHLNVLSHIDSYLWSTSLVTRSVFIRVRGASHWCWPHRAFMRSRLGLDMSLFANQHRFELRFVAATCIILSWSNF